MAATQKLSTQIILDGVLSGGYKDAFNSAGRLMSDLKRQSTDLRKQLGGLGKEVDDIEKIGGAADEVRQSMKLLERQIDSTERATQKFGDARSHFRSASIGAKAFKSDIGEIADKAKMASLAIAGIGTAAAVAFSPREELLEFDQTLAGIGAISPEVDTKSIKAAGLEMRELSNTYGESANEIAQQHEQLTRNFGFDAAQETIRTAVEFQTTTGVSITDIEEELGTARISLGIDTPAETHEFLELLHGAHQKGIKIDNLDLGDLETLRDRTGEDVFGQNFQREFLTTIAFRQVDSFQYADYAAAFKEEIDRAVLITPEMDTKAIGKAQDAIKALAKWGIRAEDGLVGAMHVYQRLSDVDRVQFFTELEPVLTAMPAEVIARGSEALPQVQQQVDMILNSDVSMSDAAKNMANTWSRQWERIGITSQNSLNIVQEQFASVFGVSIVETLDRFYNFLSSRQDQIRNFFTGIRDGVTPVISRVWNVIREAYPDVKQFALDVWTQLKKQWDAIQPAAKFVADTIWNITKAIGGFLRDHPKLVATVLTGVAAWKSYKIVSSIFGSAGDAIRGFFSLTQGHFHRINAIVLENTRVQGALQKTTLSTGQKFLTMGKDMVATKFPNFTGAIKGIGGIGRSALASLPGIAAMGASLWGAVAPILPVVLPVVAAIGAVAAGGYLIHKNWESIKSFFVDNFNTIRNVMWVVAPPIAFLMTAGQFIKQNWEGIKDFFSTLWDTVTLVFQTGIEFIKFVVLQGALAVKNAWDDITGFFKDVWDRVTGIFTNSPLAPVFDFMVSDVKKVVSPLFEFFDNFWDNIFDKGNSVINWITDKFKFVNDILRSMFGWLRKKNDETIAELKEQSGEVVKAQVDIEPAEYYKDMLGHKIDYAAEQVKVLYESPPTQDIKIQAEELSEQLQGSIDSLQAESVELANSTENVDTTEHQKVLQQGISELQDLLKRADARSQDIGTSTLTTEIKNKFDIAVPVVNDTKSDSAVETLKTPDLAEVKQPQLEIPQTQTPKEVTPNVIQSSSVDLENIALGQLAEAQKQTDILRTLVNMTPEMLAKYSDVQTVDVKSEIPAVNVPQPDVRNEIAPTVVKNQISVSPVVNILAPKTDIADTPAPIANIQTPDPSIIAMQAPDVSIATPKEQLPKRDAIDTPVIPAPIVQNEISLTSPAIAMPAPEKEVAETPAPIVNLRNPESAVDIQGHYSEIAPTPVIPAPTVINEIAETPAAVNIITEVPEMSPSIVKNEIAPNVLQNDVSIPPPVDTLQSIVKNEIAPNVLQNDVSIPPPVDTLQSHQLAVSEIRSPEPTREFLQNYNFPTERTDMPSLTEHNPTDNLLGMNRDILGEMIRQTDILEVLKPQEISDFASGAPSTYDISVMPEIVFDNVDSSPVISSPQTVENSEQVTHNEANAQTVENHFHFNVSSHPGQNPEEFARLIAEMVSQQIDESTDTFLIT